MDRVSVAEKLSGKPDILVEVNIGEEQQKSGVMPNELEDFLEKLSSVPNLQVRGLMAMPPFLEPPEKRAPLF